MLLKNRFIDRNEELDTMEKTNNNVILIYGRRRIGKTALIKEYIKSKNSFYFLAQKNNINLEFERFLKKFNKKFNRYVNASNFEEFFEIIKDENLIIVIDEFSYWVEKNPSVPSIFQTIIDEIVERSNIKLIVSGSLIGTMESLLSYKNPLYGRIKTRIKLSPLKFKYVKGFLKEYSYKNMVKVYASVGGIPAYLSDFKTNTSPEENIKNLFFNKHSYMYDDVERILKDELREPIIYLTILNVIASGETKLGYIASKAYIDITNIPKYLKVLEEMGIIKRETPVIGKSKRIIKINDRYIEFWSKFVFPYREEIEMGLIDLNTQKFNAYIGTVFEEIVKELMFSLKPINFTKIGRWWHKDKEIDIVAINENTKELMALEVKWKNIGLKETKDIINELDEKVKYVQWFNKERKQKLGIFAKKLNKRAKEWLNENGYLGFDLGDVENNTNL